MFARASRFCMASVVSLVLGTGAVVNAPAAHADGGTQVTCSGTLDSTYTPGLKLYEQSVVTTTDYQYSGCSGDDPAITSGFKMATGTAIGTCLDLLTPVSGTSSINWNNKSTSTFSFTSYGTQLLLLRVFVLNGTVTSGPFTGQQIHRVATVANTDVTGTCLSPDGLTAMHGLVVLAIGDA